MTFGVFMDVIQTVVLAVALIYFAHAVRMAHRAFTEGAMLMRESLDRIAALEKRIAELENAERLERRVTAFAAPTTKDSQ